MDRSFDFFKRGRRAWRSLPPHRPQNSGGLADALQTAHDAKTPVATEAADASVKKRLYLIGKDGVNGPTIVRYREEISANFKGAGGKHFKDSTFVDAAKERHDAKLLAEGGFTGSQEQEQGGVAAGLNKRLKRDSQASCWTTPRSPR